MFKFLKAVSLVLVFAITAVAQSQVATLTSESSFTLRGAQVSTGEGVPSWPVLDGNVIRAGTSNLTVTFPDGSTVTLAPGSEARLQMVDGKPVLNLQSGAMHYSLKELNSVKLISGNSPLTPTNLVGESKIGSVQLAHNWWTTGHTVAVVGAAGGATALGVGLTKKPPSK